MHNYESELNYKIMFKSGNGLLKHLKKCGFDAHPAIGTHLVVYPKDRLDLCAVHATVKSYLKNINKMKNARQKENLL